MGEGEVGVWSRCYDTSWRGAIVDEAFAHPAKMSRALLRRIVGHALAEGWVAPGDHILDPFGGIGATGIEGAYAGLRVTCVELEPCFVDLAQRNFALHRRAWQTLGVPEPAMLQGDSRRLVEIVAGADAVIGSPPFANQVQAKDPKYQGAGPGHGPRHSDYGSSPGQLGAMPEGRFDACVGSPPYEGSLTPGNSLGQKAARREVLRGRGMKLGGGNLLYDTRYSLSKTNIGNQIGATFFPAAREVLEQCRAVLKPGGYAIWVTKRFVRGGKIVEFSDQWAALCEATGLRLVCRHRAMLVEQRGVQAGIFGQDKKIGSSRKSFFRLLAERKGSPAIDWEDVLCFEKAMGGN